MVYGQPAVALPVQDVRASAAVSVDHEIAQPIIEARDLKLEASLGGALPDAVQHIARAIELVNEKVVRLPQSGWRITVWSKIPMGRGLGSSAAIGIAVLRALITAMGKTIIPTELIQLSFELEKIHHGTPSGIDNTVIALEKPILFRKDREPAPIKAGNLFFVVGDTGVSKKTVEVVSQVAEERNKNQEYFDRIFNQIGQLAQEGWRALRDGDSKKVGQLMNDNQTMLERIHVSSPELDNLIKAARLSGALGAKLCGAGKGGCMVAITRDGTAARTVADTLLKAGARRSFVTRLK